jgi:mannosyl-3-phosphoglycerate phosphatase
MIKKNRKTIIFTDLDGTLLDYGDYSSSRVNPLVSKLNELGVLIVFCSSKTRLEQEVYRRRLGIATPFIVENGGAIYINQKYFSFPYEYHRKDQGYYVIELGMPYIKIRQRIIEIRNRDKLSFRGFGDMDIDEIANLTGLDMESAGMAQKREYTETLNLTGSEREIKHTLSKIEEGGLEWIKGTRFYSISYGSNKGKATRIVIKLFRRKLGSINTIGVGDSFNDKPMLAEVDTAVLVQKPGDYWEGIELPNIYKVEGVGPNGWVKAVQRLIAV